MLLCNATNPFLTFIFSFLSPLETGEGKKYKIWILVCFLLSSMLQSAISVICFERWHKTKTKILSLVMSVVNCYIFWVQSSFDFVSSGEIRFYVLFWWKGNLNKCVLCEWLICKWISGVVIFLFLGYWIIQ